MSFKIYAIGKDEIDEAMHFQAKIIDAMSNKEWFAPLTRGEFETPVKGDDNVYFVKDGENVAGMCVAICDAPEILKEYRLGSDNVMLVDSIMVDEKYRGKGLQRKMLRFL